MLSETVKFFQKVALIHDDHVLILRRSESAQSRPRGWDLPGGNSEWPTDLTESRTDLHQEDAVREVWEETGIQLKETQFPFEKLVYLNTHFDVQNQMYSIFCGWGLSLPDVFDRSTVELSDEHTEYAWVRVNELSDYDFGSPKGEYIKEIIRKAFNQLKNE